MQQPGKYFVLLLPVLLSLTPGQTVYWEPAQPVQGGSVSIYYDAVAGTLPDNASQVFIHYGYNGWQNISDPDPPMSYTGTDGWWRFDWTIPNGVTVIDLVFRDGEGNWDNNGGEGVDWHIRVFESGLTALVLQPEVTNQFGDPARSPAFADLNDTLQIVVSAVAQGTRQDSLILYIEGVPAARGDTDSLAYDFIAATYGYGGKELSVVALDSAGLTDTAWFMIMVNPPLADRPPPAVLEAGINYRDATTVTLVLFAPYKDFVYVLGDFNDWRVDTSYYLNRYQPDTDSTLWWITIPGLSPGTEYAFQYLVDGEIRIADPYTSVVLDSWNDPFIDERTYPNLKAYPSGKTEFPVAVLEPGQVPYEWKYADYVRPEKGGLIIYELLVRDFVTAHNFQTLTDTLDYLQNLGISAIELMPVNEFEGNLSWGYNSSFYFAPDKYYGPQEALKAFIDECHRRGIAVILDIVLNHSYGQSPFVRLYNKGRVGPPTAENPWYNQTSNFQNPEAQWGNDFNHESRATQTLVDRINHYWLSEFHIDGFRFDFTKGFGNNPKPYCEGCDNWGSSYDVDRIRLLKRIADRIWEHHPQAYLILEHLAENKEEQELADHGFLLWANANYNYNEATMGYHENGKSDFSWSYYQKRGWTVPHLVTYMESHDEERLMVKNLEYGNRSAYYDVRNPVTALNRMKLAGAFFFTLPGPKMIWQFGELGYDISIDYNGRLGEKPIRWDYLQDPQRMRLYQAWATLIRLRKEKAVFHSPDTEVALAVRGSIKTIKLAHPDMDVLIVGNFGVTQQTVTATLPSAGTWYDFFRRDSITVTETSIPLVLRPGSFTIFTSSRVDPPESDLVMLDIETEPNPLPSEFELKPNYPNPFNPGTSIEFVTPEGIDREKYILTIHDLVGREVWRSAGATRPGLNTVWWPGRDHQGVELSSGVYLVHLKVGALERRQKITLLR